LDLFNGDSLDQFFGDEVDQLNSGFGDPMDQFWWRSTLGFRDNPLDTNPIKQNTLDLYVGHTDEIRICSNVLAGKNMNLIIEGARGGRHYIIC